MSSLSAQRCKFDNVLFDKVFLYRFEVHRLDKHILSMLYNSSSIIPESFLDPLEINGLITVVVLVLISLDLLVFGKLLSSVCFVSKFFQTRCILPHSSASDCSSGADLV